MSLEHKRVNPVYRGLIQSSRWRKMRAAYVSAHPLCARCLEAGRTTPTAEVHHITPLESCYYDLEKMRELCYDERNLMSVCRACHAAIHTELGERGKEGQLQRCKDKAAGFASRFFGDLPEEAGI